jgi:hypothetical protein
MAACISSSSDLVPLSPDTGVRGVAADLADEPLAPARGIGYGLLFSIVFIWFPIIAVTF